MTNEAPLRQPAGPYTDDQLRQIWNGWDEEERDAFFWFISGRSEQGTYDAVRYVQSQDRPAGARR